MGYEKWDNVDDVLKKRETTIKNIRFGISAIFALGGAVLLGSQVFPLIGSYVNGQIYTVKEDNIATPVPDSYKDELVKDFGYDPGSVDEKYGSKTKNAVKKLQNWLNMYHQMQKRYAR